MALAVASGEYQNASSPDLDRDAVGELERILRAVQDQLLQDRAALKSGLASRGRTRKLRPRRPPFVGYDVVGEIKYKRGINLKTAKVLALRCRPRCSRAPTR
jgi:hypothetical protein